MKMEDWEVWEDQMYWDDINGMPEPEEEEDEWQGGRPIIFLEIIKEVEATKFFRTSIVRKNRDFFLQFFYGVV